jgi:hypothetical protein
MNGFICSLVGDQEWEKKKRRMKKVFVNDNKDGYVFALIKTSTCTKIENIKAW